MNTYYEKDYWGKKRKEWNKVKTRFQDQEVVELGDKIANRKRPTPNQVGTFLNIIGDAPTEPISEKN